MSIRIDNGCAWYQLYLFPSLHIKIDGGYWRCQGPQMDFVASINMTLGCSSVHSSFVVLGEGDE